VQSLYRLSGLAFPLVVDSAILFALRCWAGVPVPWGVVTAPIWVPVAALVVAGVGGLLFIFGGWAAFCIADAIAPRGKNRFARIRGWVRA
jgi:hypothetical protein